MQADTSPTPPPIAWIWDSRRNAGRTSCSTKRASIRWSC